MSAAFQGTSLPEQEICCLFLEGHVKLLTCLQSWECSVWDESRRVDLHGFVANAEELRWPQVSISRYVLASDYF